MKSVAIIGATGYTGLELCRLLAAHPQLEVTSVFSQQAEGLRVSEKFPHFRHISDLVFKSFSKDNLPTEDVVFYALPHGVTHTFLAGAHSPEQLIVDLSADFRLNTPKYYSDYYGYDHPQPDALKDWVLGFSELNRDEIKASKRVANPGCYSTSMVLGLAPLVKNVDYDSTSLVVNAVTGVSGAGKALKETSLFCEANESVTAYGTGVHRHTPEVKETLGCDILFSPHLVPMDRGILASIYFRTNTNVSQSELLSIYSSFYEDSPFVNVVDETVAPSTKWVKGSNDTFISPRMITERSGVIFSAIDNLVKGAAGQAIQNVNLMLGLDEALGLDLPALSI